VDDWNSDASGRPRYCRQHEVHCGWYGYPTQLALFTAYQTFVRIDGRIPADDMAFFGAFGLPINIYQIDTIHVTMQGMTR
jgi:hypothetical protein